jgi:hypothetical protein
VAGTISINPLVKAKERGAEQSLRVSVILLFSYVKNEYVSRYKL